MQIGLFFGSFNPIHVGHLILANTMVEMAQLDKVWFVVSPQNPFKKQASLLHEFDRYDMVKVAISDNPRFDVTDIEFHMPKPSYTIDTLQVLSQKFPKHRFRPIIGQDNLHHFHKWKDYQAILEQYGVLVYPRPGSPSSDISLHPHVEMVDAPMLDISATFIRRLVQEGKSMKYLVTAEVEGLIKAKGYYR